MARCSAKSSSVNRPRISSVASLLDKKTSRHIVGSLAAIRVKVAKARGRVFDDFAVGHTAQIICHTHHRVGDKVRRVAGDGQHQIMVVRVHFLDV